MSGYSRFRFIGVTLGMVILAAFSLWFVMSISEEPVKGERAGTGNQAKDKSEQSIPLSADKLTGTDRAIHLSNTKDHSADSNVADQSYPEELVSSQDRDLHIESRNRNSFIELLSTLPPGLSENDIPPEYLNDPEHFKDLLKDLEDKDDVSEDGSEVQDVYFSSTLPDLARGTPYNQDIFSPYSGRIYALFDCSSEPLAGKTHLLVKWYSSQGGNLLYEYMPISPGVAWNYIWKEMGYWDPGEYKVEVHELPDELEILASGVFTVSDVTDYVGHPGLFMDPDDSVSLERFSNNDSIYLKLNLSTTPGLSLTFKGFDAYSGQEFLGWRHDFPPGFSGTFTQKVKDEEAPFPSSSYVIEIYDPDEMLVGRSRFVIVPE